MSKTIIPEMIELGRTWGGRMRRRADRTREKPGQLLRQCAWECGMDEDAAAWSGFAAGFIEAYEGRAT